MIQQLSMFLENRSGRLSDVTSALGDAGINISSLCLAESADFGVLRMIVSDPQRAHDVLRDHGFSVTLTDVICVSTPNAAGSLHAVLADLSSAGIGVEYLYAFALDQRALCVLRTTDMARSIAVLGEHKVAELTARDLKQF
jgi:hypothetical protein